MIVKPTEARKTTILVTLPEDFPGALHQVLSAFAWRRINLSRIESRPTKKRLGNYFFYIDIEASMDSVLLPAALQEIEAIGCQVRILGNYPTYSYEPETSEV
ncbi:ACT domain-containing protein [Paenibacillus sp. P25]|nr:ACT domain-containing protein [Paenibacillus sp. P25]